MNIGRRLQSSRTAERPTTARCRSIGTESSTKGVSLRETASDGCRPRRRRARAAGAVDSGAWPASSTSRETSRVAPRARGRARTTRGPSPPAVTLLAGRAITKSFGSRLILDGADLAVEPRARIGVVGPNGSGKSTLLKILAGLETPDGGEVSRRRDTRSRVPRPAPGRRRAHAARDRSRRTARSRRARARAHGARGATRQRRGDRRPRPDDARARPPGGGPGAVRGSRRAERRGPRPGVAARGRAVRPTSSRCRPAPSPAASES